MLSDNDVYISGRGIPTTITRTYNSRSEDADGVFGYGWSSELDVKLFPVAEGPIAFKDVDGTVHYFKQETDGTYVSPPGLYLSLIKNADNTYTITDKSGIKYNFANNGDITDITDLNGNTYTYLYTNGEISGITDASGRTTSVSAKTNNERTITDYAGIQTNYYYSAAGDLNQVTKALGTPNAINIYYEYDSSHNLSAITDATGYKTYFYYWQDDRVKSINQINMVMNANFEVDSDGNNISDFWTYNLGQDGVASYDINKAKFGYGSLKLTVANTNPYSYSVYLSDNIPVDRTKDYTLSGYLKASQTSGSLNTVLSLIAYNSSDQSIGEFARFDNPGTFDWQATPLSQTILANTLPTETAYVRVKLGISNGSGTGESWFDGIQLEEGTAASDFVGPMTYTVDRSSLYSAAYDANGKKVKYRYNDNGNVLEVHVDPNGFDYLTTYTWDQNETNKIKTIKDANATLLDDSITYSYDANGNPLDITIDDGDTGIKNTFGYDGNNDLITAIDGNENNNNPSSPSSSREYYYDETRNFLGNNIGRLDVTSSISYDSNGNVLDESSPIGLTENIILNSSFENDIEPTPDNWPDKWINSSNGTATVTWGSTPYIGNKGIAVSDVTGIGSYAEINSETTYTFDQSQEAFVLSAYVNSTTEDAAKAAYLKIDALDQNGVSIKEIEGLSIGEMNKWNRLHLVIWKDELPAGTVSIKPALMATENTGTVYFDNVQLEKTSKLTAYNMVENGSFENGETSPDYWSNTAANPFILDNTESFLGNKSIKIENLTGWAGFTPDEYITFDVNKEYAVAGFVKGVNVSNPEEEVYLKIKFFDSNKNEISSIQSNRLSDTTTDWTLLIAEVKKGQAPLGTAYIKPVITAHDFTGTAYFDHIRVQEVVHTSYEYNDPDKYYITKITDPKGNSVSYTPDAVGNILDSIDAKGNTTSFTYDSFNRLETIEVPGYDLKTTYHYYDSGNLEYIKNTTKADVEYNTTNYYYNKLNLLEKVIDPLTKETTYQYDAAGNLTKVNYPNFKNAGFVYDKANRLSQVTYDGVTEYTFGYDANGNRTSVTDKNNKTWDYQLDRVERLDIVTAPDGSTQDNDYDKNNNRISQTITVGATPNTNNYYYSTADKPTKLTDHNQKDSYFAFDEKNNLVQLISGNGTMSTHQFDDANLVNKVINTKSDGAVISSYSYTHDPNGNIETITDDTGKTISYSYDSINQLLTETDPLSTDIFVFQYDNLGNRTKKEIKDGETVISMTTYGYNTANQLTHINGILVNQYDENGNLEYDNTKKYVWDSGGRLIEVRNKADLSLIAAYEYDSYGRRVKSIVYGVETIVTNYHYDGASIRLLYETDSNNNLTTLYTYSHDGILLSMTKIGQGNYYYHYNAHGDVVKLTVQDGTEVASYTYDVWGNIVNSSGTIADSNPYRYAGYRYDSETGLYYLMARYYDANTGRFISRDPVPNTVNEYVYAGNNPVMNVDPNGEWFLPALFWLVNFIAGPALIMTTGPGSSLFAMELEDNYSAANDIYNDPSWGVAAVLGFNALPGPSDDIAKGISNKVLKQIKKKWRQNGVDAFIKAANKGIVNSKGENGITVLKGGGVKIGGKTYTHEIKVKNKEYGDYRIFGYMGNNGEYVFDRFGKGLGHK